MRKIGIISLIRITQSKVRAFQKSQKSSKTTDFQSVELWTAWSELSLWYQFSTQNLMPSKFHLMGLAKFRQLAILAVSGGYFTWLLWQTGLPDFGFHIFELPRTWAFQNGIPIVHWVFFLKWLRGHMWIHHSWRWSLIEPGLFMQRMLKNALNQKIWRLLGLCRHSFCTHYPFMKLINQRCKYVHLLDWKVGQLLVSP